MNSVISKPTKAEYEELKDFKFRVTIELHNAIQLIYIKYAQDKTIVFEEETYTAKIGNATFTFFPSIYWRDKDIRKLLNKFTTTVW